MNKELLHQLFDYKDGNLYWKITTGNAKIGQKAGNLRKDGYEKIGINKKPYLAHRLIWLYHNDVLHNYIDHIDGNPTNNKIENLRLATNQQNQQNSKLSVKNSSGIRGVHWHKQNKKWTVKIRIGNSQKYFGQYFDIDYAKFIADAMRHKYHGQFARGKE